MRNVSCAKRITCVCVCVRSFSDMESPGRRVAHHMVGVFLAGSVRAVDDRAGLPDQTQSLPVNVHHVHHLDRHQLVHRVLDVGRMR